MLLYYLFQWANLIAAVTNIDVLACVKVAVSRVQLFVAVVVVAVGSAAVALPKSFLLKIRLSIHALVRVLLISCLLLAISHEFILIGLDYI